MSGAVLDVDDESFAAAGPKARAVVLRSAPWLVDAAAALCAAEWPATGQSFRAAQLRRYCDLPHDARQLPAHVVVAVEDGVAAHARLAPAEATVDGRSAALTSVVVDSSVRGRGVGRALLLACERLAGAAGFGYVVLWCSEDLVGFYSRCGYVPTDALRLERKAHEALGVAAITRLEAVFARRQPPGESEGPGEGAVWLRKRVAERSAEPPVVVERSEVEDALRSAVRAALALGKAFEDSTQDHRRPEELEPAYAPSETTTTTATTATVTASDDETRAAQRQSAASRPTRTATVTVTSGAVSWERQVGPSCGLCALRLARSVLTATAPAARSGRADASNANGLSRRSALLDVPGLVVERECLARATGTCESLLESALAQGFSSDGEIYDVCNLADLAARGDVARRALVVVLPPDDKAWRTLIERWLRSGGCVVVAYDRDSRGGHAPLESRGHGAHYALVVGLAANDEGVCVLALLHGLSRRPLTTSLAALRRSNAQIAEMKPQSARSKSNAAFVCPPGGVRLANRLLLLE